eukprot:3688932-Rhodomonas_salina.2
MALSGNRGWIPPESLKAMVLEEQDHKVQLGLGTLEDDMTEAAWVRKGWYGAAFVEARHLYWQQYRRGRDLFGLVLAQEVKNEERYKQVCNTILNVLHRSVCDEAAMPRLSGFGQTTSGCKTGSARLMADSRV